jgi:hypothetical protein
MDVPLPCAPNSALTTLLEALRAARAGALGLENGNEFPESTFSLTPPRSSAVRGVPVSSFTAGGAGFGVAPGGARPFAGESGHLVAWPDSSTPHCPAGHQVCVEHCCCGNCCCCAGQGWACACCWLTDCTIIALPSSQVSTRTQFNATASGPLDDVPMHSLLRVGLLSGSDQELVSCWCCVVLLVVQARHFPVPSSIAIR